MALTEADHVSGETRMAECIDNCFEAAQACEWCATASIEMGDEEMSRCIQLCRDVSDVASLHARMMARNSDYHAELAETCAEICESCAEECEQFDHDHCQTCADVLRECADSCQDMSAA